MAALILEIATDIPDGLELEPLHQAVTYLNEQSESMHLASGTVNLAFVDEDMSRSLNMQYAGNDYATDVLSFDYVESGGAIGEVIGELIICWPIAQSQATEAASPIAAEVALLVVHGLLHLSGYDHQTDLEQDEVQLVQQAVMTAIGQPARTFEWHD